MPFDKEQNMNEKIEKHPVQKEDLFKLKFLQGAKLSPDASHVVYVLSHVDVEKEEEYAALWLMDLSSGETRQLTAGTKTDSDPDWSPDGKKIAFRSTRDGTPQIYVIPVDGGEARPLTSLKRAIGGGPKWSPDGRYIAFTAGPEMEEPPDPTRPYRVTRNIYRYDAMGYLHNILQNIFIIPAEGGEAKQLTDDQYVNLGLAWSPDGQEILYSAAFPPDSFDIYDFSLRLVNMEGQVREVISKHGLIIAKGWTPDGKHILFQSPEPGLPIGSKSDLWIIRRHGSQPECRTAGLEVGVGGGLQNDAPEGLDFSSPIPVSADGKYAYVNVQVGGTIQVYKVALLGEEDFEPQLDGDRDIAILDMQHGTLLCKAADMHKPSDLLLFNLEKKQERQLTHINDEELSTWEQPSVEHLLFKGIDDQQVEGWIMLPAEGKAPYPTILYIHGGPHGAFGHTFSFDFHMLSGAGYAVLFVNHRASTGYGSKFGSQIKGDWGNLDYKDLMAGVDYAIEKGYTDPDRMGVCGLSGGGNLSCWIVGQTDRFKAAVPENPVTNFLSFYGISDIGVYFALEELGGHPHEIPDIYAKCSPITYAHNCTTPTLLIQGESDFRCPAEQSEQFYTVLKANGCVVEMLRLPNSPHAGAIAGPIASRKAQNDGLLDWMNRYVMGKTE
jgi:dipeptidyl aminopeptidase/acylaminoacyl peptidase